MRSTFLLGGLEYHDRHAYAQPLLVYPDGRILRFTLRPGQSIEEHDVPDSPFYVVVLKGYGMFAGSDGKLQRFGPNSLLVFDPGEHHSVRALDEELVFIGCMHGAPGARPGRAGGEMSR